MTFNVKVSQHTEKQQSKLNVQKSTPLDRYSNITFCIIWDSSSWAKAQLTFYT